MFGVDYIPLADKKKDYTEEELRKLANEVNFLIEEGQRSRARLVHQVLRMVAVLVEGLLGGSNK